MPELFKYDKRVIFKKGAQRRFIETAASGLHVTPNKLAKLFSFNNRVLCDWKNEKRSMPLNAVKAICDKTKTPFPKQVSIKNAFWHTSRAGTLGALAILKKYGGIVGNEEYRLKKWREWWNKKGKYENKTIGKRKKVSLPRKSNDLAELFGIILGDGGISEYQITVTLNRIDDKDYSHHVTKLIKKLFELSPTTYDRPKNSVLSITLARVAIRDFLIRGGLKKGNKVAQQVDIPKWIMDKPSFKISCLRGLIDTDGSIFEEVHRIKDRVYRYPRMSFVSHSKPLRESVCKILLSLDFSPKIRNNRDVNLEQYKDIVNYFRTVGTSNPKHRKRFERFK